MSFLLVWKQSSSIFYYSFFQAHPYFFQDITNRANLTWYRDDKRDSVRTEFLCRVITSSMEFIHQETAEGSNLSASQAVLWMSKCQNLASIWKINNDELRIHQVCQLYIMGFDRLAEEVITEWFTCFTFLLFDGMKIFLFASKGCRGSEWHWKIGKCLAANCRSSNDVVHLQDPRFVGTSV